MKSRFTGLADGRHTDNLAGAGSKLSLYNSGVLAVFCPCSKKHFGFLPFLLTNKVDDILRRFRPIFDAQNRQNPYILHPSPSFASYLRRRYRIRCWDATCDKGIDSLYAAVFFCSTERATCSRRLFN